MYSAEPTLNQQFIMTTYLAAVKSKVQKIQWAVTNHLTKSYIIYTKFLKQIWFAITALIT